LIIAVNDSSYMFQRGMAEDWFAGEDWAER